MSPDPFPLSASIPLIAPLWDDYDATGGGNIGLLPPLGSDESFSQNLQLPPTGPPILPAQIVFRTADDEALLAEVGSSVNDAFDVDFSPTSLFIATWDGVPRFGSPANVNS